MHGRFLLNKSFFCGLKILKRTGLPVSTTLFLSKKGEVSGKDIQIFFAIRPMILFAVPGSIVCSCVMIFIPNNLPIMATGRAMYPPKDKMTTGFSLLKILYDFIKPLITLKNCTKILSDKTQVSRPVSRCRKRIFRAVTSWYSKLSPFSLLLTYFLPTNAID